MAYSMNEGEVPAIARLMLRQYGELAVRLMATRARSCARHGERESAAFWHRVGKEVSRLAHSPEAAEIRRAALRKTTSDP
jgi:hypothetical protein